MSEEKADYPRPIYSTKPFQTPPAYEYAAGTTPRQISTGAPIRGRNTIVLNEATIMGILNEWLARTMPSNSGTITAINVLPQPNPIDPSKYGSCYHIEMSFDQPAFRVVPE